jgi:two-component system, cell cycle sensor histidine kinase and response regulator CckA
MRDNHVDRFDVWAHIGFLGTALGYSCSSIAIALESGAKLLHRPDPWVVVIALLGLLLYRSRRSRAAMALLLFIVWAEMNWTVVVVGTTDWASAGLLGPLVALGSALWFGVRASLGFCLATPGALVLAASALGATFVNQGFVFMALSALGAALRDRETNARRARDVINGSPDAVLSLTPSAHIEDLNPAAEQLIGVSRAIAIGESVSELPLTPQSGSWTEAMQRLSSQGCALELLAQNGRRQLEALARPFTREDGSHGLLVVLRDITARRLAEARAREYQAQLQHAQKLELVGRLAGGVAHDFNNLLTAVGGYGALLSDSSDPHARIVAAEILEVQARGAALVRQLLTFARREENARPRPIDLSHSLGNMKLLLARIAGDSVRINMDLEDGCHTILDPAQLEQIVLNLVANARDAMVQGGDLWISARAHAQTVELEVRDSGAGIPREVQARLFEPFFTTKPSGKGTGLGLATVHNIVAEAGGSIRVLSRTGAGTAFVVILPRTHAQVEPAGAVSLSATPAPPSARTPGPLASEALASD